jgi:cold shock CspA family protein
MLQNLYMDESAPAGQFEGYYQTGTVWWFSRVLEWGFIVPDGDGPLLFADTLYALPKRSLLHTNQHVRFRVHFFTTGLQAVDILPAGEGGCSQSNC